MNNPKVPNPTPEGSITAGISNPGQVAVDKKGRLDDQVRQPGPQFPALFMQPIKVDADLLCCGEVYTNSCH